LTPNAESASSKAWPLPADASTTVLEASAGTGKTYTVGALVARYVAEGVTTLDRMLVITFGRAASQELRERVRDQLVAAERALADPDSVDPSDMLLTHLVSDDVPQRRKRVTDALAGFDGATIATTHQFCQLVLRSLGVAGDTDSRAELVESLDDLVVEVTDGTASYNAGHYRISVPYDLAKVSVNRLAFSLGHELAPHGATAVCLTPGWLRSELMLEGFGVTEANWQDAPPPDFALSESPRFVGRAVAALATDPDRARWNQRSLNSGELAQVYGFTDVDGSRPDIWRWIVDVQERGLEADYDDFR